MQKQDHSLTEIEEEMKLNCVLLQYEIKHVIGQGAFAIVLLAYDKIERRNVAIKIVEKKTLKIKAQETIIREEAKLLGTLIHKNIIKLLKFCETTARFYLIMDFIEGKTLEQHIIQMKKEEVQPITKQILKALSYLHSKNIVHRDIKPENIIISYKLNEIIVTLIDFGLSTSLNDTTETSNGLLTQNCGTLIYMAPEIIRKGAYTRSIDIWALGIVVYNMLTNGQHPIYEKGEKRHSYSQKILAMNDISLNCNFNEVEQNFLLRTLAFLPENRLTSDQCLQHPWITGCGDLKTPLTLSEIIKYQVQQEQQYYNIIKSIVFLNFLKGYQKKLYSYSKLDEIQENYTNTSMLGSKMQINLAAIQVRPFILKNNQKIGKFFDCSSSNSNSIQCDSSRNTSDVINDSLLRIASPNLKEKNLKILRKSKSMNQQNQFMLKSLQLVEKKNIAPLTPLIRPESNTNISYQRQNYLSKLITEPTRQSSKLNYASSPTYEKRQQFIRSQFSKKPQQL